ncbi:type VI secretion system lipoprotein TssJ [endosymbiont of Lamellibrachia barhami]|uniref:type VI secretion system lipoprotein TssJ n=1 Tax=endosymbiont of Lamellibrachia barhami TaxID=205975 RepID=UPI0015A881DE|nr:type VI secretion system lipoprotein TssJ [endosymbiont of Lamellibrachia barhami]
MRSRHLLLFFTLILSLLFIGCGEKKAPPPTQLAAKFLASLHVNPNAEGTPSPVVVRFYELKTPGIFEDTDFFTLYDGDIAVLGADLVARNEFKVMPGKTLPLLRELDPKTRFIGVMAAFRDLNNAIWRATAPIALHQVNAYTILLGRGEVSISETKPARDDEQKKKSQEPPMNF